jgi:hypothetical protein
MPGYNDLRRAYGLAPKANFAAVVGSGGETFPRDPKLTPGNEINDPDSLDFTALFDNTGASIPLTDPRAQTDAVNAKRRTGLAARLKAIYGSVDRLDAFVGMMSEPRVAGSEFGELQRAIWTKQFLALRDGDRFFYGNVPVLNDIKAAFGIDYHRTLAQIIAANTDIAAGDLSANVFVKSPGPAAAGGPDISALGANPGLSFTNGLVDGRLD